MTAGKYDVIVIGGGNAALCAALSAAEVGASVLLLESAPREWRGRELAAHAQPALHARRPQDVLTESYPEEEYWQDLKKSPAALPTRSSRG